MKNGDRVLWIVFESQSLSGWDGVFHRTFSPVAVRQSLSGRNPFQGGMGFFTEKMKENVKGGKMKSQSLSGWDGVFHLLGAEIGGITT